MRQQILARGYGWGNLNLVLETFVILRTLGGSATSVQRPP
jgi:hypothetical protein